MQKIGTQFFILLFLTVFESVQIHAQDPQISQPFAVASSLSPAFTGMNFKDNVQVLYRNQFPNLAGNYTLGIVNLNMSLPQIQSGVGLSASYDEQFRNLITSNLTARYAYHIILNKKSLLSAGIEAGWQHRSLNSGNYVFPNNTGSMATNVFDPSTNSMVNSANFLDLGAGLLYYTQKTWIGFSTHHINKPNQSVGIGSKDVLQRKYSLQVGTNFELPRVNDTPINVSPIIYVKNQGKYYQVDLGTYVNVRMFELGLWYRGVPLVSNSSGNESLVGLIGFSTADYNIGYSRDFLLSNLRGFASGANEITFAYFFNQDKENMLKKILNKRGKLPCPKF